MKANELRIGNWVRHYNSWSYRQPDQGPFLEFDFQWDDRDWYGVGEACMEIDKIEAIPITPEWLKKFGFEYEKQTVGGWERWENKRIKLLDKKFTWGIGEYSPYIQYVHQLQNLYFALTGEELQLTTQQQPNNTTPDS